VTARQNIYWGGLLILLFAEALMLAKAEDPFCRRWFTLKTSNGEDVQCVTILPKPIHRWPLIIFVHGAGEDLLKDGNDLRRMAELGIATVSLEYSKSDQSLFNAEFQTLLRYLDQQDWVNTNCVAWVGFSLGANRILNYSMQCPTHQPRLLVLISGAGVQEAFVDNKYNVIYSKILFVHGIQDEVFALGSCKQLAAKLQNNGVRVDFKELSGLSHDLSPERAAINRAVGEYCLAYLTGDKVWDNYRSIAQWQVEAPGLLLFFFPAILWVSCWSIWFSRQARLLSLNNCYPFYELALRWETIVLFVLAIIIIATLLLVPRLPVTSANLVIARKFLVQSRDRDDFEYLAARHIWHGQSVRVLLDNADLANYNRELINWQLDNDIYQQFVLSPVITADANEAFNWRRELWEEFYPLIRHESSAKAAAQIVVRHLRERITISTTVRLAENVPAIWLQQITDKIGFQIIYVAALRSVGIPSRLDKAHYAQLWDNNKWQSAPAPTVTNW
jgi:predicted esterase